MIRPMFCNLLAQTAMSVAAMVIAIAGNPLAAQPPSDAKAKPAEKTVQRPIRPEQVKPLINDVQKPNVSNFPLKPYLESSSMLVVDIDLTDVDMAQTSDWISDLLDSDPQQQDPQTAQGVIDALRGAGVQHLYVTAAARSLVDGWPLVVIPCENTAVVESLAKSLAQAAGPDGKVTVHSEKGVVLVGTAETIARVTKPNVAGRADLIDPLRAQDRFPHVAVISLPPETRRNLIAMWPDRLPSEFPIELSPRAAVEDISRVVCGLRLPPDPLMTITIETESPEAAKRVQNTVTEAFELVPQIREGIDVQLEASTLKLSADPAAFGTIASAVLGPSRQRASAMREMNNLKQIGLAIHNYIAQHKQLPPIAVTDANGQPLHSWRVSILPYIEQRALYNSLTLDQAWNSEANRQATSTVIPIYGEDSLKTTYRAPLYPGSIWDAKGISLRDVTDGTSNTIAVINAPPDQAVDWADPQPWKLNPQDLKAQIFGDRDQVQVLLLDGAALTLARDQVSEEQLKAMLTIAGGEVVDLR